MNKLVWKLLRQHISIGQLTGFFCANLFGMFIVLLSIQFYRDVLPVFTQGDSFMKREYIIITKKISTLGGLTGKSNTFSDAEIKRLEEQDFVRSVGAFTPSQFKVSAGVTMPQMGINLSTAMFFEAVPDAFIDANLQGWEVDEDTRTIPIIIPHNYLNLYNFGFAQSRSLPKISESLLNKIQLDITLRGNGRTEAYKGNIVGFSNRLNTILVPRSFIEKANNELAPAREARPARLIVEVKNPTDSAIADYLNANGYDAEGDSLDAGHTTYFLRMATAIVMGVGVIISLLSFYLLMLSIFLLLQKNSEKLKTLMLIGYSIRQVSMPYCALTIGLNLLVWLLATVAVVCVRPHYTGLICQLFPRMETASVMPCLLIGLLLFFLVSLLNVVAIRRKVVSIWRKP